MHFKQAMKATLQRPQPMTLVVAFLVIAGCAWLALVLLTHSMGLLSMTMGFSFVTFIGMWTLMMSAMMLPSITPLASRYLHIITVNKVVSVIGFAMSYLSVWITTGIVAFGLSWCADTIATTSPRAATILASAIFAIGGIYQLTPLKDRCLKRCRVPFALLLHYAAWRGPWRHVRVGLHHGTYCVGCCWSLMLLMLAFGIMNLGAMIVLAVVVVVEKSWTQGVVFSRFVGVTCCALAVAVIWLPGLAPGLLFPTMGMSMSH